jgi:hypothetical protein
LTGREDLPRHLKIGASLVEGGGRAAALFARIGSRIEAAQPLPGFLVVWLANTAHDRANVNIAEIDVPTVLAFGIPTAGEGGHGLLKRSMDVRGKPLRLVVRSEPQTKRPPEGGLSANPIGADDQAALNAAF